ncbi:hypothetical protein HK098_005341 [Nowakowskiella sp. JEL0407]|nr:hypothetical protein HK098_005341 [Nowakowskiella sp. JEL0407]
MNAVAEKNGWANEEREMLPLLVDQGIACIPWSPLARGVLSGKVVKIAERMTKENELNKDGVICKIISPAMFVTAPIVGIGKEEYLNDSLEALKLKLSEDDVKHLEEPPENKDIDSLIQYLEILELQPHPIPPESSRKRISPEVLYHILSSTPQLTSLYITIKDQPKRIFNVVSETVGNSLTDFGFSTQWSGVIDPNLFAKFLESMRNLESLSISWSSFIQSHRPRILDSISKALKNSRNDDVLEALPKLRVLNVCGVPMPMDSVLTYVALMRTNFEESSGGNVFETFYFTTTLPSATINPTSVCLSNEDLASTALSSSGSKEWIWDYVTTIERVYETRTTRKRIPVRGLNEIHCDVEFQFDDMCRFARMMKDQAPGYVDSFMDLYRAMRNDMIESKKIMELMAEAKALVSSISAL